MTVTKEIEKLEKAFKEFNAWFYNNELETPVIQFYADPKEKTYGWITRHDVWNQYGEKTKELNICANTADRDMDNIYATLLHEMAHLYNMKHGITDVSNNGYYHNKRFKETAEAHGLIIEKDKKYGWNTSFLSLEAQRFVSDTLADLKITMSYKAPTKEPKEKKQNSFKHVCPKCGAIARTTKDSVHLICSDCMEVMVIED